MTTQVSNTKPSVHFILQGKGGAGKTYISLNIAQYFQNKEGAKTQFFDTDPINTSFSKFKSLNVNVFPIMENNQVNPRFFDDLIEKIINEKKTTVIDTGSTTFISILAYIYEQDIYTILKDSGFDVYTHVVVSGGQDTSETLNGLDQLVRKYKFHENSKIVAWFNPYHGELNINGEYIEKSDKFKKIEKDLFSIIKIQNLDINQKATFGKDLQEMLEKSMTFKDAAASSMKIMVKQRLKTLNSIMSDKIEEGLNH